MQGINKLSRGDASLNFSAVILNKKNEDLNEAHESR